jgi:hypothetical protein
MLDFPSSPSIGQVYPSPAIAGVPQWRWDGAEWVANAIGALALTGAKIRVFASVGAQTYTPTPGLQFAMVECVGGGGGGGGVAGVASNNANGGGGGGGAAGSRSILSAAQIGASQTIFVAGGGNGGAAGANSGGSGGTTSFGTLVTAPGATGGSGISGVGSVGQGGAGGLPGTGDAAFAGESGGGGFYASGATGTILSNPNNGGRPGLPFGHGGRTPLPGSGSGSIGANGLGYGSGGSGAMFQNVAANYAGGAGAQGICIVTEFGNFGTPAIASAVVRGHLFGLTLATAGSSATFSVAAGIATDSNAGDTMMLASAMSKTTGAWAAGSGNGALDTGAIANNTWYHVYLIKNPTSGAVDVLISLSATTPTVLPSGYSLFRRIGSMRTNASGQWILFRQNGDEFLWDVQVTDASAVATNNGIQTPTLTVPTGVQVNAFGTFREDYGTAGCAIFMSALDAQGVTAGGALTGWVTSPSQSTSASQFQCRTSTAAQIRLNGNAPGSTYNIVTQGWIDTRGKLN